LDRGLCFVTHTHTHTHTHTPDNLDTALQPILGQFTVLLEKELTKTYFYFNKVNITDLSQVAYLSN
jgi:hypothetical protein